MSKFTTQDWLAAIEDWALMAKQHKGQFELVDSQDGKVLISAAWPEFAKWINDQGQTLSPYEGRYQVRWF